MLPPTVVIHPEHTPAGRRPYPQRLAGPDGTGAPTLTAELAACNGARPFTNDPFAVPRLLALTPQERPDEQGRYFACCQTGALPYDLLVTAALIRLQMRFPTDVEVSSDGGPPSWEAGRLLCADVFGTAALPPEVAERPW